MSRDYFDVRDGLPDHSQDTSMGQFQTVGIIIMVIIAFHSSGYLPRCHYNIAVLFDAFMCAFRNLTCA
jgi:hypothetical protein